MARLTDALPEDVRRALLRQVPEPLWRRLRPLTNGTSPAQVALRRATARRTAARLRRVDPDGLLVTRGTSAYLARCADHIEGVRRLTELADDVAAAFARQGVEHLLLEGPPRTPRFVVAATARPAALAALATLPGPAYVSPGPAGGLRSARPVAQAADETKVTVLRVFRVFATASGAYVSGPDLGVDVEFWDATPDGATNSQGDPLEQGSLRAPRPNRWTDLISPQTWATRWHGRLPHVEDLGAPVDAVYTWVDDSDPQWAARKAAALGGRADQDLHPLAADATRFRSRDELRYSLRSLQMYAGWVRHIYLVTDDQVPDWLDTAHKGLTVVSHRELFGSRGVLPTFNSHAIESQLHHIDGLAEHFLYLNDDVFFGRPVTPELFFTGAGQTRFHYATGTIDPAPPGSHDTPAMSAAKNGRELIAATYGRQVTGRFQHVPHALRRSVLAQIEQTFPDEVARTAAAQFRSSADLSIAASFAHHVGFVTGRAVPGDLRYFYADLGHRDTADRLIALERTRSHDVFCLNDYSAGGDSVDLLGFLRTYFPQPSAFERR